MKLHLLDLGNIEYDEGFPLAGAGVSTLSEPSYSSTPRSALYCSTPALPPTHARFGLPPSSNCSRSPTTVMRTAWTRRSPQRVSASTTSRRSYYHTFIWTMQEVSSSSVAETSRSMFTLRS
jgi:hypothetical protein